MIEAARSLGVPATPVFADGARRTSGWVIAAVLSIMPVTVGFAFYDRWLDLFPQIEFRTWMWSDVGLKWYFDSIFTHQGAFSRSSSFLVDSATRDVCGVSVYCINQPGFWAILIAAYLLFWLIVRLTARPVAAAVATTIWVLSLPVLDAFSWQATLGDRLATLFGLATIHVALWGMRWVRQRPTVGRTAIANLLVVIPAIITYNSKEISWMLLPSLILLAIALADKLTFRAIALHASVLILPAVYVAFRTADTFVLISESASSNNLDFGGDPIHNAKLYIAALVNHLYFTRVPRALLVSALGGVLLMGYRYRREDREGRREIRIAAWAALSLVGGIVICLFTPYPSPYLLLLPSTFLPVVGVATWHYLATNTRGIRRHAVGCAAGAVAVAAMLVGLDGSYRLYGDTLSWSHNFRKSLPAIADNVPMGASTDFVIGRAPFLAYRFVGDDGQRVIDPFIYDHTKLLLADESRLSNVSALDRTFHGYSVVLNDKLAVIEILHGSRVIYLSSRS